MNKNKIAELEAYFKTDNEYWNEFALDAIHKVIRSGLFEDPEQPVSIINDSIALFEESADTPLAAFYTFIEKLEGLTASQGLLVVTIILKYLEATEYEKINLDPIRVFIKGRKDQLELELNASQPKTNNIRQNLKEAVQKELGQLPQYLSELDPLHRLNILCKLIPYVLPKVESVNHRSGED